MGMSTDTRLRMPEHYKQFRQGIEVQSTVGRPAPANATVGARGLSYQQASGHLTMDTLCGRVYAEEAQLQY